MQSRTFTRLMAVMLVGLFSLPALAQYTRDKAARKKIEEAVNQHYLMMELDKAEAVLTGTIEACENKCSPQTLAEAWMYVGIVRGSGRNDQAGAGEAFRNASAIDPAVKLDAALATPETQQTFAASGGTKTASAPPAVAAAGDDISDEAIPGDMLCTPEVRQVETRRPIPVSCHTEEAGVKAELKFKAPGGEWKKVAMRKVGDEWQGEIPCDETNNTGTLQWYVQVSDKIDEVVDSLGSRKQPVEMRLLENTSEAPPAFPGQAPPARCTSTSDCPPDFPGCGETSCGDKDWGVSCDNSSECKCGLLCVDGACETAPSCDMDEDCPSGSCVNGTCAAGASESSSRKSKHWFGVHGAIDVLQIGNFSAPCDPDNDNQVSCFALGDPYPYAVGVDGQIERPTRPPRLASGFAPAQIRALLSYEFMFHQNMSVGLRAGFAFQGAPKDFIPAHAEARFSYYFLGNEGAGFHPYVHAGGGFADVQGLVQKNNVESCYQGEGGQVCDNLNIKMYQKSGPIFATVGAGFLWNFTERMGLKLNVNAMFLFPDPGTAIQPSLGLVYGL